MTLVNYESLRTAIGAPDDIPEVGNGKITSGQVSCL